MGGGRSLSLNESEHLRAVLRTLLVQFGTQVVLAQKLGVTQQSISTVLNHKSNGSYPLARAAARLSGQSVDEMLAGKSSVAVEPPWSEIPGFVEAIAEARRLYASIPEGAWEWIGRLAGARPPALNAVVLGQIALAYTMAPREEAQPERSTIRMKGRKQQ